MRSYFKKRQSIFIKLIHDQAAFTLEGMEALKAYMAEDASAAARLIATEKQADEARRILIAELNKTFITPFDREDIFHYPGRSMMYWIMHIVPSLRWKCLKCDQPLSCYALLLSSEMQPMNY